MKFENEDAYRLARDYMLSREGKLSPSGYFLRFLESYELFDKWLQSSDPKAAAKEQKAATASKGFFD